ncbi:NADH:ubiquinone reductase (Na(+)-transporting) subunit C [Hoylesella timonensis]|uniref:Na(+)-translocating NADH-quinone reductase subunit C n=1 Tax=Hoylesella timonensis S9-PR14 TaxID=1401062 RepID=A0A098YSH4_9BACT|nr:NADH:ubiquinone reductase (Na(+)-transporting) subunit C [Hoylesella timonensis]KGI22296.1 Na(+)-translocating NADH-quinone reductase subunit C [Hoylesella timonensis S9-PR14]
MAEENKKGLNTNSNSYTIIYSIIIVILVAFLLAFVFQVLKPMQDANVALDKKKQILNSLNIRDLNNEEAAAKYQEVVLADEIIDEQGNVLEKGEQGGENYGFKLNSADFKNGKLALFVCKVDGQTKYVIPVYGMGLWGAINGYIAINADKSTVFGTYFDHESETAGLGAEIKDNRAWQNQFQGKKLFAQDPQKIALAVSKKVEDPATQVDGITGATLTSNGVTEMLQTCLGAYMNFLKAH